MSEEHDSKVYEHLLDEITELRQPENIMRIAIDGVDGSGKTWFADNLASYLTAKDIPVIRVSLDDFHNVREKRYRQGRLSPRGFYEDSYDYEMFVTCVLKPVSVGGNGIFRSKYHDVVSDDTIDASYQQADPNAVLIVDGIFSNRNELRKYWDYSIFLDADFETTFQRMAVRDGAEADPSNEKNRRYHEGQLLYFEECNPRLRASIVIDNRDFNNPKIIRA